MEFQGPDATIYYEDFGEGRFAFLVHGFGSNHEVNWVSTSWSETLTRSGYRVITPDLRGHGRSQKFHDPADYAPEKMAGDMLALMDDLGVERCELIGYSMGARVAVAMAAADHSRFRHVVLAGVGETLVNPVDDPEVIAKSLLGEGPSDVPPGGDYLAFAQRTGSDVKALAACIRGVRTPFDREAFAAIKRRILVVAGEKDTVAGDPDKLAKLHKMGESRVIPGKDHMSTVGDLAFKRAVLEFMAEGA